MKEENPCSMKNKFNLSISIKNLWHMLTKLLLDANFSIVETLRSNLGKKIGGIFLQSQSQINGLQSLMSKTLKYMI
jgi:hypothetical protein